VFPAFQWVRSLLLLEFAAPLVHQAGGSARRCSSSDSGKCNREQGGPEGLAEAGADKGWALPLGAAVLAVRHLGLSSWQPQECFALENEIGAWQAAGNLTDPTNALRCTRVPHDALTLKRDCPTQQHVVETLQSVLIGLMIQKVMICRGFQM